MDHAFGCPPCSAKLRALIEIRRGIEREAERIDGLLAAAGAREPSAFPKTIARLPRVFGSREGAGALGLRRIAAVAGLAIVGIALAFLAIRRYSPDSVRDSFGGGFRLIEPVRVVVGIPVRFRWTPVPGADAYTLAIIDESLVTVIDDSVQVSEISRGGEPGVALTESERGRIKRGATYLWRVNAIDDDGRLISSARGTFVVRAP